MLKRFLQHLLLVGVLCCSAGAWAETGNDALFEVQFTGYARGNQGSSLLATQLYAEQPLPVRNVAAFLVVHHDRDFDAVYAGIARQFGDLQAGLGFGSARYDGRSHPTLNPWLFYTDEVFEVFLTAEHYGRESRSPWFYKGHASTRLGASMFAGVHGEKDVGMGPLIGWRAGNIGIWGTVPMVSRPEHGPRGVAGVQIEF